MKKAEGLTLNTMAIAAIVLVVIIVTIAIFSGVAGDVVPFFKDRTECSKQANSEGCVVKDGCDKGTEIYGLGCPPKDKPDATYCCVRD